MRFWEYRRRIAEFAATARKAGCSKAALRYWRATVSLLRVRAVPIAAALNVTEPMNVGMGGDLFAIIYIAKSHKLYALDASGNGRGHHDRDGDHDRD